MAVRLELIGITCHEPATSFGDDIRIFVNDLAVGDQFNIDKGGSRNLGGYKFDFSGQAVITFTEDNDPCEAKIVVEESMVGTTTQRRDFKIKDDGKYSISFQVVPC